jgi:hypothetical protein
MEKETHALHHERKGKKHIMCVMCPDDEATATKKKEDIYELKDHDWAVTNGFIVGRNDEVKTQQTKRDPDDEIKQRHDAMKLAMNDPDKMREYYEEPCY